MIEIRSKILGKIIKKWPGAKYFGVYRFLPLFFVLGAALEFSMINWRVGTVNFCKLLNMICMMFMQVILDDTFKRREAEKLLEEELLDKTISESKQ